MVLSKKQKYGLSIGAALLLAVVVVFTYFINAESTFDLLSDADSKEAIKAANDTVVLRMDGLNENYNSTTYSDRAVEISKRWLPERTEPYNISALVITTAKDQAETLQGAVLASNLEVPLLVTSTSLYSVTKAEITRLNPKEIYVVGSDATLSTTTFNSIDALYSQPVTRIGGSDKFSLSKNVAVEVMSINGGLVNGTIVVTDSQSPYAGIVGNYAGIKKAPVLYAGSTIPTATSSFISTYKPTKTVVVGATGTVSSTTFSKLPGATRIDGSDRYEVSRNLHRSARKSGAKTGVLAIASGDDEIGANLIASYMARFDYGMILVGYDVDSSNYKYIQDLHTGCCGEQDLTKLYAPATDLKISNASLMKYSNALGNNFTTDQLTLQGMVDTRIQMCPILSGTLADYGDAKGYQAIGYYSTGKIIISPSHTATLTRILDHEVYHIYDWRDNGKIDWGESVPRTSPDCTP